MLAFDAAPTLRLRLMERLTFSLTDPQLAWLQKEAKKLGISTGELLRRLIDERRTDKN